MMRNPDDKRPIKKPGGHNPVHFATKSIPLFSGRPHREKVIGRDDLMDLDILLNTCRSIDDFIAKA